MKRIVVIANFLRILRGYGFIPNHIHNENVANFIPVIAHHTLEPLGL
jgi:hypothetical protein